MPATRRKHVPFEKSRLFSAGLERGKRAWQGLLSSVGGGIGIVQGLQRQNAQLQAIYDAMGDGLIVFDSRGQARIVNRAQARLFGYPSVEALRQHLDYFAEIFELRDFEGRVIPIDSWPVSRVLRGEHLAPWELNARRKDTGQQWVVRFSGEPVLDRRGRVLFAVMISSDITERVLRERELAASEQRFRALADSMPQLVWTADDAGIADYYNARAREYRGIERQEGRWSWQPVLHPDDLELTLRAWQQAVAEGRDYACEHRVCMADGSYRWHVSRARRVRSAEGERWFGTATDIHEQKEAEANLRVAISIRDQVVSVVAHDLRNPLSVVRTSLPLLSHALKQVNEAASPERGEPLLERLDRQVTKMERILDELLDVARLQAGQPLVLHRQPCDLVALVREVVSEENGKRGRPSIELQAAERSLMGDWDAARIERVLSNLLSNALKYSPRESAVRVEVEELGDDGVVRVVDRGMGIAEGDRERIFEWFARGKNAERTARGIGIGLAGARRIVEEHGGRLSVESELGVGSVFTLLLPLKKGKKEERVEGPLRPRPLS